MTRTRNIIIAALVVGALLFAAAVYVVAFAPNTPDYEGTRSVRIPRDSSFDAVVDSLDIGDILSRRTTFAMLGRTTGWGKQVKAGHYAIPAGFSNRQILDKLRKGLQDEIRLTIPPGSRREVVARVLANKMAFSVEDFLSALSDTSVARAAGTDTTHLFGFMHPDTYFFYWLTDAKRVVTKIKSEFDDRYERLSAQATLSPPLSAEEVITVASIVEWETTIEEEKPRVAGVYLNRLRNGWRLQADPTVQYAILQSEGSKRRLFFRDYDIVHPFNTYRFAGLPPGPITNPSLSSIEAVLKPESHKFYYFVATGDGGHIFSRTLREHRRNARNYYRVMEQRRDRTGG